MEDTSNAPKQNLRGGFYATPKAIPGRVTMHPSLASQTHAAQVAATRNHCTGDAPSK